MISLMSAHKRAEEFAAAVEGPHAEYEPDALRADLAPLVNVVAALQAHARSQTPPTPSATFSATLRQRLMAEAADTLSQKTAVLTLPPRRKGARERRLAIATSAFVLVGGTAGMAAAAQNALPGESLYQIKRGFEEARTSLSGDSVSEGRSLLGRADTRLGEVRDLLGDSAAQPLVASTLEEFVTDSTEGSELIIDGYAEGGDEAAVTDLRSFTADAMNQLGALASTAPVDLQNQLGDAALMLQQIDQQASDACSSCGGAPVTIDVPAAFRPAIDAERVLESLQGVDVSNDHPLISRGLRKAIEAATGKPGPANGSSSGQNPDSGISPEGDAATDNTQLPDIVPSDPGDAVGDVTAGGNNPVDKDTKKKVKDNQPEDLDPLLDPLLP